MAEHYLDDLQCWILKALRPAGLIYSFKRERQGTCIMDLGSAAFEPTVTLKVPKCEIFDRSDFPDFYSIKSSWAGNLVFTLAGCTFV